MEREVLWSIAWDIILENTIIGVDVKLENRLDINIIGVFKALLIRHYKFSDSLCSQEGANCARRNFDDFGQKLDNWMTVSILLSLLIIIENS